MFRLQCQQGLFWWCHLPVSYTHLDVYKRQAQGEAKESGDVAEEITQQLDAEQKKSTSYQALLNAYAAYTQNEYCLLYTSSLSLSLTRHW